MQLLARGTYVWSCKVVGDMHVIVQGASREHPRERAVRRCSNARAFLRHLCLLGHCLGGHLLGLAHHEHRSDAIPWHSAFKVPVVIVDRARFPTGINAADGAFVQVTPALPVRLDTIPDTDHSTVRGNNTW